MQINEQMIREIVTQVLQGMETPAPVKTAVSGRPMALTEKGEAKPVSVPESEV